MGKFTVKQLEALKPDDIGRRLFDGEGLSGRVRQQKSGLVVTFEYRYKLHGKARSISCGKWPTSSLQDIRRLRNSKSDLVSEGIDPVEQNRLERMEKQVQQARAMEAQQKELARLAVETAACKTFGEAIQQWEQLDLIRRKDRGQEAMRAINKDILPALKNVPISEITRPMLLTELDKVVARGARVMANHLYASLRQFYNYAAVREWVEVSPLAGLSKDKIGGREQTRERHLSENEIKELKNALPKANFQPTTEHAIWIMLATCCRVGELSQAQWRDIDFELGTWFIPAGNSKNARNHTKYLSDFSRKHFLELHNLSESTEWCFPARGRNSHICLKSISKQIKDRTRDAPLSNRTKAAGSLVLSGGPWTPHDLRRTGATLMGELGVMGEVIERCLNHLEQNKLKRIYQRHEFKAEQREAWRLLGDRLALLHSAKMNENVVVGQFTQSD
jgi:integrase